MSGGLATRPTIMPLPVTKSRALSPSAETMPVPPENQPKQTTLAEDLNWVTDADHSTGDADVHVSMSPQDGASLYATDNEGALVPVKSDTYLFDREAQARHSKVHNDIMLAKKIQQFLLKVGLSSKDPQLAQKLQTYNIDLTPEVKARFEAMFNKQ